MSNNQYIQLATASVLSSICLIFFSCKGSKTYKDFKDEAELNQFLTARGYIIKTNGGKSAGQIESVKITKSTLYESGDFKIICTIPTLKQIVFESADVHNLREDGLSFCANISGLEFYFRKVKLNEEQICEISEKTRESKPSFYFSNTNLNDNMLNCLMKIHTMQSFGADVAYEITEDAVCKLSQKITSVTYFGLSEAPFSRRALECIFSLPNLNFVFLQHWSQVPGQEIYDLLHEYENRHGRKLESVIDDPTSIDSTVWPKENQ
ncbi:MAG: hypothetical protein O9264_10230 [Leptospira sp.]|nr:hypothetical protein [Leptospira sp.]